MAQAIEQYKVAEERHTLSRDELLDVAEKAFKFCMEASGISLYPYQQEFGRRICQSVILGEGEEITALFARQSGKTETVAVVTVGLMVILPTLATVPGLNEDDRINKYKDGFWCGIFAPTYELGAIMHSRMAARMNSADMAQVLADPDIGIRLRPGRKSLRLPNGSFCDCNSAGPQSHIEGKTYHLILCEETQDIGNYKIRKSIHPMGAATNASIVKIGTPSPHRNDFYDACERGRKKAAILKPGEVQTHFEYDYEHAARWNPRYRKYIDKEVERLGYDSDDFRMSYRLHWLLERGVFIPPEMLDSCGIKKRDILKSKDKSGNLLTFVRPDYPGTQDRSTVNQVASLDIGRSHDSTVLTVGRVWWDNPQRVSGEDRYYVHVMNWLEIQGDDHESQYPQILEFLRNYNVGTLIVDATGRGDPIASRLRSDLKDVHVIPFVFNQKSKHRGYQLLYQDLRAKRLTYPAGQGARKMTKYRRFVQQLYDLEKRWKGKYMDIRAPKGSKSGGGSAHDDYPDSLMLLNYAVQHGAYGDAEVIANPLMGRGLNIGGNYQRSKAWFREGGRRGKRR